MAMLVQRCLHRLGRPWYRLQALRVFRDQTSLAANPDLWAVIEAALAKSRYFILLACPESARSEWIRREVVYWQEHRDRKTFLIVVTGGRTRWGTDDFDWARTTALPAELRGWFDREPLWVTLRGARGLSERSSMPSFLRDEMVTLAAAVHEVPKDRLDSEDIRQRRRTRLALALFGVVVLALVTGLGYAVQAKDRQHEIAVAESLRAQAEAQRDRRPQDALRLGLAAYALDPTPRVRGTLLTTVTGTHYAGATPGPINSYGVPDLFLSPARFSADGRLAGGVGDDNRVPLWDISHPEHAVRLPDLVGNTEYLNDVAFSPDDRTVAIANRDDTVSLWDIADHAHPRPLTLLAHATGEKFGVDGVAFSHDGTMLATVGSNDVLGGTVALWNVSDRGNPRLAGSRNGVYDSQSVVFSPDDRLLVTASGVITAKGDTPTPENIVHGTGVTLWDISDRVHPANLTRIPLWEQGIAFSPDGRLLALGHNQTTDLWDVRDPGHPRRTATLTGHTDIVQGIAFSPDGHLVATGGFDDTAILWDITDPARPARLSTLANGDRAVAAVRFTTDSRRVTTVSTDGSITNWRVESPAELTRLATLPTHTSAPAVAVSPDGRTIASADGFAGTVTVWDLGDPARPARLATLSPDVAAVQTVAFSADGSVLAAGGANGRIVLWDVTERDRPRRTAAITGTTSVTGLVFEPHRPVLLASGSANPFAPGWATLWDVRDRTHPVRRWSLSVAGGFSGDPVFAPNGRTLLLPGDVTGRSSFWDVRNPSAPVRIPFAEADPAGSSGSVSRQPAFAPDGRTLASVGTDGVVLWDVHDLSHTRQLAVLNIRDTDVDRTLFAPGGQLLATVGEGQTTMLWAVADPTRPVRVATVAGHTSTITDIAFSPQGRWLATASADGTILLWRLGDLPDLSAVDPIATACRIAGGGLTPDQWNDHAPGISFRDSCPAR